MVCFSSDHTASFGELSPRRVRTIIEAWADRTTELSARPGIEQVYAFENRGPEIGVTLPHPHGQIYAFPYVTPRTRAMLDRAAEHRRAPAATCCATCSTPSCAPAPRGRRVGALGGVRPCRRALARRGAPGPAPRRARPAGPEQDERADLASTYPALLRRLDRFFVDDDGSPVPLPYVSGWHQAVVGEGRELGRLHLQLLSVRRAAGKLKYLAGVESGMASWISDTTPERVAARLREIS